jgi:hypothetical protein
VEAERPQIERLDDKLDQWGRPKRALATPIDAMPEEQRAKAYEQLEEQMAREARRAAGGGGSSGGGPQAQAQQQQQQQQQ